MSQFFLLSLAICLPGPVYGDDDRDESFYVQMVNSMGESLYALAWPSATYERTSYESTRILANGADIRIRLHGKSYFSDTPLWTDLIIKIRDNRIADLVWGEHNAILAAPGETVKALGQAMMQLTEEYMAQNETPTSGTPSSDYQSQISAQMNKFAQSADRNGFTSTHNTTKDKLNQGEIDLFNISLQSDYQYVFASACDNDCTDIDLYLLDSEGNVLASDTLTDAQPLINFTAPYKKTYTVKVKMVTCGNEPCFYNLAVFGKPF